MSARVSTARWIWFILSVASCTIAAPPGAQGADEPRRGGTFVEVLGGDPRRLNPGLDTDTNMYPVGGQLFNALVAFDFDLNPVPELATGWTVSRDGLTYTFQLAKGVTWHDGKPFTSADVKFTFQEVVAKHHPRGRVLARSIESVETPDTHTAVFRLKEPSPAFLFINRLANGGAILPKHLFDGTDVQQSPHNSRPVGTGPFRFKEWRRGEHILLERNPNYWKAGLPYLDQYVFRIIPDPAGRIAALQKGEVDYLGYGLIPYAEIGRVQGLPGVKVVVKGDEATAILTIAKLNLRHPALKQLKVRRALAQAVNLKTIVERAHYGIGGPASGPIHSDLAWAYSAEVTKHAFDPQRAQQLLDEAGFPRGADGTRLRLSLAYTPSKLEFVKTAEIMRENLAGVGVALDLKPLDDNALSQLEARWEYDLHLNWYSTGPDPAIGVQRQYDSGNIQKIPAVNTMGYSNPEVDRLFRLAAKELDRKQRARYYHEVQRLLTADLPVLWVHEWRLPRVYREGFENVITQTFTSDQRHDTLWQRAR